MVARHSTRADREQLEPVSLVRTRRRVGRLATVVAALGFVALVAVTLVVALLSRSWDGLEAVAVAPLVVGVVILTVWVSVLSVALVRGRLWATLVTFLLAGVTAGVAFLDTADRTLVDQTAPVGHLALPVLLLGTAGAVVSLVLRDLGTRAGER